MLKFDGAQDFHISAIHEWIYKNADGEKGLTFIVTCWVVWKAQNVAVFNDENWEEWHIINQIHAQTATILHALPSSSFNRV